MDHYIRPLLEYRKLIAAVTTVVTLLGIAAWIVLPTKYEATTSVLLKPISADPLAQLESGGQADVDLTTELLIATSAAVTSLAAEDLAAQSISISPDALANQSSASSPRNSKVLEITFEASTPELAQIGADTMARNYLLYRAGIAADNRADAVASLNERVTLLKDNLADVESEISRTPEDSQPEVALTVERDSLLAELTAQQDALASLSTLNVDAGEILDPAGLPVKPAGIGLLPILVGAMVAGLLAGAVLAMLVSAIKASSTPRNRRASDRVEHNRRQEDRFFGSGRRASDKAAGQTATAVERLEAVTAEAARAKPEEVESHTPEDFMPVAETTEAESPTLEAPVAEPTTPEHPPEPPAAAEVEVSEPAVVHPAMAATPPHPSTPPSPMPTPPPAPSVEAEEQASVAEMAEPPREQLPPQPEIAEEHVEVFEPPPAHAAAAHIESAPIEPPAPDLPANELSAPATAPVAAESEIAGDDVVNTTEVYDLVPPPPPAPPKPKVKETSSSGGADDAEPPPAPPKPKSEPVSEPVASPLEVEPATEGQNPIASPTAQTITPKQTVQSEQTAAPEQPAAIDEPPPPPPRNKAKMRRSSLGQKQIEPVKPAEPISEPPAEAPAEPTTGAPAEPIPIPVEPPPAQPIPPVAAPAATAPVVAPQEPPTAPPIPPATPTPPPAATPDPRVASNGSKPAEAAPAETATTAAAAVTADLTVPTPPKTGPFELPAEGSFARLNRVLSKRQSPAALLSVGERDRETAVATAFAFIDTLRLSNQQVLIIDAMLNEPRLKETLNLLDGPGLTDVLLGQATLESVIQPVADVKQIHAVPTGQSNALAESALSTQMMRRVFGAAKRRYAMTIMIVGDIVDAAMITRAGDSIDGIVTSTTEPSGHTATGDLAGRLREMPAPVLARISTIDLGGAVAAKSASTH